MPVCCGRRRRTPCCPQCGKLLVRSDPLLVLLDHCQHVKTTFAVQAGKAEQRAHNCHAEGDLREHFYLRSRDRAEGISEKWQRFAEVVMRAVTAAEEIHGLKESLAQSERERERLYQQLIRMGAPAMTLVPDGGADRQGA